MKNWTKEEISFLIENYLTKGGKFVSKKLNRSVDSIKKKARRINLISYTVKKWTDEEIDFLKKNYNEKSVKFISNELNKKQSSVTAKARSLGLTIDKQRPNISKEVLEEAVKISYCLSNLIDNLGKVKSGTYLKIVKKYLVYYNINTSHFDPYKNNRESLKKGGIIKGKPIEFYLTFDSKISSSSLKEKLYKHDLKQHFCEKCGQGELWKGEKMSLILDHENGNPKDNRIENLRILCPNCNATLSTHCRGHKGIEQKNKKAESIEIAEKQKINGLTVNEINRAFKQRKTIRPLYSQLLKEIKELGYSATGKKYNVSDNTVRKWIKFYEKYELTYYNP